MKWIMKFMAKRFYVGFSMVLKLHDKRLCWVVIEDEMMYTWWFTQLCLKLAFHWMKLVASYIISNLGARKQHGKGKFCTAARFRYSFYVTCNVCHNARSCFTHDEPTSKEVLQFCEFVKSCSFFGHGPNLHVRVLIRFLWLADDHFVNEGQKNLW